MKKLSVFPALGLLIFFLFPFVFLIFKLDSLSFVDIDDLLWALKNSFLEAAGSATLALALGWMFFSALVQIKNSLGLKIFRGIEVLCLIPGMMPSLFTILILLSLVHPFPLGLRGIILVHGVIYSGFMALSVYQLVQDKAQSLMEVAYVLGASRWQIFLQLLRLLKWDLLSLWIMIFSVCFTSFAVPLAVGGGWGTTIEVLIYEKIRLSGAYSQALFLSCLQSGFLFVFSFVQRRGVSLHIGRFSQVPILGSWMTTMILFFALSLFYGTFGLFSVHGWRELSRSSEIIGSVLETISTTFFVGLLCGACVYLLMNLAAMAWAQAWLRKWLIGYVAPSTALVGLIVILLRPESFSLQLVFFVLAFVSVVFCGLYRMGFDQKLSALRGQIEVAEVLGATPFLIFRQVVFPQMHALAARLSGIAALWMVGDFALSRMIFSQDVVLAQVVQGLINGFHLDIGMAVMNIVIVIGLVLYFLFERFGHVLNNKAA